jgi:hypothetical protein
MMSPSMKHIPLNVLFGGGDSSGKNSSNVTKNTLMATFSFQMV